MQARCGYSFYIKPHLQNLFEAIVPWSCIYQVLLYGLSTEAFVLACGVQTRSMNTVDPVKTPFCIEKDQSCTCFADPYTEIQ